LGKKYKNKLKKKKTERRKKPYPKKNKSTQEAGSIKRVSNVEATNPERPGEKKATEGV